MDLSPICLARLRALFLSLACALVTACGGGGSPAAPAPPADTTAPTVAVAMPPSGSASNAAAAPLTVSFSEPLNCASVNAGTLAVFEESAPVAGTTTCSGNTLTFHPTLGVPTNTILTATVNTSVTDLSSNALASPFTWSFGVNPWTPAGTATLDSGSGLAIDTAGNLYVAGDIDGGVNGGSSDTVLVKYDTLGVKQWSRQFGTAGIEFSSAVITDAAGNVYVAGSTDGNMIGNPTNFGVDGFRAKYDSGGSQLWVRQLHSDRSEDAFRALAMDPQGNIVAVGSTRGSLFAPILGTPLDFFGPPSDLFVAKYDSSGALLWGRQLGTTSADTARGVVTDSAGNIYVAGSTGGGLDGGADAPGNGSAFLLKYDSSGIKQWVWQDRSGVAIDAYAIAIDSSGNTYLAGSGGSGGSGVLGGVDAVVIKFDGSGAMLWTRQIGLTDNGIAVSITVDAADNVVVGGWTLGGLDGNASAGGADVFVVKYDSAGAKLWSRQTGTTADDYLTGVRVDAAGDIYAVGTRGFFDGNFFLLKYGADGKKR
jgi:hypothetical protein